MRLAIVTGASRNIGLAIARRLLRDGWNVCLSGRDENALAAAALELGAGNTVRWVAGDVGVEADAQRLVDDVEQAWGAVDAVIKNAGIGAHGPVESLDVRDWNAVLSTVLTGAFLLTRANLQGMRERGWGRIVISTGCLASPGRLGGHGGG